LATDHGEDPEHGEEPSEHAYDCLDDRRHDRDYRRVQTLAEFRLALTRKKFRLFSDEGVSTACYSFTPLRLFLRRAELREPSRIHDGRA
jgi:hypothetical protein